MALNDLSCIGNLPLIGDWIKLIAFPRPLWVRIEFVAPRIEKPRSSFASRFMSVLPMICTLFCYALFKVSTIIKVGYIFHGTYSAKNWLNSISKSNHGETHWSKLNFLFNIFLYLMLRLPQCDHQKSLKKSIVSTRFFSIKVNFINLWPSKCYSVCVITGNNLLYRNKG